MRALLPVESETRAIDQSNTTFRIKSLLATDLGNQICYPSIESTSNDQINSAMYSRLRIIDTRRVTMAGGSFTMALVEVVDKSGTLPSGAIIDTTGLRFWLKQEYLVPSQQGMSPSYVNR